MLVQYSTVQYSAVQCSAVQTDNSLYLCCNTQPHSMMKAHSLKSIHSFINNLFCEMVSES